MAHLIYYETEVLFVWPGAAHTQTELTVFSATTGSLQISSRSVYIWENGGRKTS